MDFFRSHEKLHRAWRLIKAFARNRGVFARQADVDPGKLRREGFGPPRVTDPDFGSRDETEREKSVLQAEPAPLNAAASLGRFSRLNQRHPCVVEKGLCRPGVNSIP